MSRILAGVLAILVIATASLWVMNTRLASQLSMSNEENHSLRMSIERGREAQKADQVFMEAQFKTIQALDKKIKELFEYAEAMPEGGAECLAPADVDRLRELWR